MRTWMAGLLALSALTPVAAGAQRPEGWRDAGERAGWRDRAPRDADSAPGEDGPRAPQGRPDRDGSPRGGPDQGRPQHDRPDRAGFGPGRDGAVSDKTLGRDRPRPDREGFGPDRGDPAWRDAAPGRPDRGRGAAWGRPGADGDRDDWARSRFPQRDDGWTRSRFGGDGGGWDRGWRNDRRYDWNRARAADRGRFRLSPYRAPIGFGGGYHRVAIGVGLSTSLWSRGYWIDDPYSYSLPQAWGPYRWVRYYDDALLIDLRRGVVVDAAYGIFW